MIAYCPKCPAKYRLTSKSGSDKTRAIRCRRCGTRFEAARHKTPRKFEDSGVFSLENLTKRHAEYHNAQNATTKAARTRDSSGLIDLFALAAANETLRATRPVRSPSEPTSNDTPSAVGGLLEDDAFDDITLSGLSSGEPLLSQGVRGRPRNTTPLWTLAAMALAFVLGFAVNQPRSGLEASSATGHSMMEASAESPLDVTVLPRTNTHAERELAANASVQPKADEAKSQRSTQRVKPRTPRTPVVASLPRASKSPIRSKALAKDPCAHCKGDLVCAMRCAVKHGR